MSKDWAETGSDSWWLTKEEFWRQSGSLLCWTQTIIWGKWSTMCCVSYRTHWSQLGRSITARNTPPPTPPSPPPAGQVLPLHRHSCWGWVSVYVSGNRALLAPNGWHKLQHAWHWQSEFSFIVIARVTSTEQRNAVIVERRWASGCSRAAILVQRCENNTINNNNNNI